MGINSYGELFTKDAANRIYATEVETDKDILTIGATESRSVSYSNISTAQTGAIADADGMVYTVGYNGNG